MKVARQCKYAHHSSPRPHAFTLIELLVVISIVALLMAILLPVLSKARQTAQSAQCLAHLRQYGVANAGYMTDFRFYFTAVEFRTIPGNTSSPMKYWFNDLVHYINTPLDNNARKLSVWRCPSLVNGGAPVTRDLAEAKPVDYSWNGYLGRHNTNAINMSNAGTESVNLDHFRMRDNDIYYPTRTVLVMDAITSTSATQPNRLRNVFSNPHYLATSMNDTGRGYFHQNPEWKRNAGYANAAFIDGHASSHQSKTIKRGWFKVRKWWRNAELTRNSPIGD